MHLGAPRMSQRQVKKLPLVAKGASVAPAFRDVEAATGRPRHGGDQGSGITSTSAPVLTPRETVVNPALSEVGINPVMCFSDRSKRIHTAQLIAGGDVEGHTYRSGAWSHMIRTHCLNTLEPFNK